MRARYHFFVLSLSLSHHDNYYYPPLRLGLGLLATRHHLAPQNLLDDAHVLALLLHHLFQVGERAPERVHLARVEDNRVGSRLFHVVAGADIDQDVCGVRQRAGHVQRRCERDQQRLACGESAGVAGGGGGRGGNTVDNLAAVKKQLDDELVHLTQSHAKLRQAQTRFRECIGSVKQGVNESVAGIPAPPPAASGHAR